VRRLAPHAIALLALLLIPLLVRQGSPPRLSGDQDEVIVITASAEQIRDEFGDAFDRWHQARHGRPARVVWSAPGGAIEIRRLLLSAWESRLRQGLPVGGDADILMGGGSFEFDLLKRPVTVQVDGQQRSATVLEPVRLAPEVLRACFPEPELAGQRLLDPDGNWFGIALSSFGIVWNGPVLAGLKVAPPRQWADLADARLRGWVTMVNPSQSGSVLAAFDSIVQRVGWRRGIAILRRAAANARTFAPSGTRAPLDVAAGDAAMAVSIDFYARFEAEAVAAAVGPGAAPRVGFTVPAGESTVDPDPVGMLRNAPHPEMARRFIEFCLSPEAQRLWQLPPGVEGGPRWHALRRMPIMRSLYERESKRFVDPIDPFRDAGAPPRPMPGSRAVLAVLFSAMAMDCPDELREAWGAIVAHPAFPRDRDGLVLAEDVSDPSLRAMLEQFDALPEIPAPGRALRSDDPADLAAIESGWIRGGWSGEGLWSAQDRPVEALRARWTPFFIRQYDTVRKLARSTP
jgi:hypothetical protein